MEHVWHWFWVLSERRQRGMSGPQPLQWTEINAWREMMRVMVLPEEIDVLLMMDSAWLEAVGQFREEEQKDSKR